MFQHEKEDSENDCSVIDVLKRTLDENEFAELIKAVCEDLAQYQRYFTDYQTKAGSDSSTIHRLVGFSRQFGLSGLLCLLEKVQPGEALSGGDRRAIAEALAALGNSLKAYRSVRSACATSGP
jgi:hypothetical protein